MRPAEAAETLQAMRDNLDPRFMSWTRERQKSEALRMAIDLLEFVADFTERECEKYD